MNFLKNTLHTDQKTVPEAQSPGFKNAQALEEDSSSPVSPTFGEGRRTSGEPNFKYDMFRTERTDGEIQGGGVPTEMRDRRMSKEWDASKVPPSRFQKRAGSIHATPASRDGHIDRNNRSALFEKLSKATKGERRKSQS